MPVRLISFPRLFRAPLAASRRGGLSILCGRSPNKSSLPWRSLTLLSLCAASLLLSSCSGGSNDSGGTANYQGTWNARYNLPIDDCQIVLPSVPGFVDVLEISQTGSTVTVGARSGFFADSQGTISDAGDLSVISTLEGDFFGNGSLCRQDNSLSFSPSSDSSPADGTAAALFEMTIVCSDGFECVSRAVGTAERQPAL
jgi:hypothetical protein